MPILTDKVTQFVADADVAHQIVHGGAGSIVPTDGGPVRTFAKVIADADAQFAAQQAALLSSMQSMFNRIYLRGF